MLLTNKDKSGVFGELPQSRHGKGDQRPIDGLRQLAA